MRTIRLGGDATDGLDVSALCLGTMDLGTKVDEAASFALLDRYHAAGGRFIDTANNYAAWNDGGRGGESESLLGRWLADRGVRDEVVVATKCGALETVPGGGRPTWDGLGADAVHAALDGSLERLRTERVDVLYAHVDDRATPLEETLAAFDAEVRTGRVGHVAVSNFQAWRLQRALDLCDANGWARPVAVQQRMSVLRPLAGAGFGVQIVPDEGMLDLCAQPGAPTLLAYSPLLGGSLADPAKSLPPEYAGPAADARLAVLRDVAAETGATVNQVTLAWLGGGTPAVLPVIAASRTAQLEENLAALDVTLTAQQRGRIDAA